MSIGNLKMVLNVLLKIHWVPFTELFNIAVRNSNVSVVKKLLQVGPSQMKVLSLLSHDSSKCFQGILVRSCRPC